MRLGTRLLFSALYMACRGKVTGQGLCSFMSFIDVARRIIASMCASSTWCTRALINMHGLDLKEVDIMCERHCVHWAVHTCKACGSMDARLVAI